LNAFGLHRKKEETPALILEENARKNPAKPWISNRQVQSVFKPSLTGDGHARLSEPSLVSPEEAGRGVTNIKN